ncbi:MAG: hypothetical protein GF355_14165 [Candidatus Eisenbacteria bacterium]|nr:hypothetical protein [Candidatus Eisenbacteria bacterium]
MLRTVGAGALLLLAMLMAAAPAQVAVSPAAGSILRPAPQIDPIQNAAAVRSGFPAGISRDAFNGPVFKTRTSGQRAAAPGLPRLDAKKSGKSKGHAPITFRGKLDVEIIYDDNIVRYSNDYLDDFRHGRYPYKFAVETYDDLILSPTIDFEWRKAIITNRQTRLRFRYTRWEYTTNRIKNNEAYSIRLYQPTWGRDHWDFGFYVAPLSYIRQLPDHPPFTPSSHDQWVPFKYTYNSLYTKYHRRLNSDFRIDLRLGRTIRYYNRPLMENDNWEWNYGARLYWYMSRKWRLTLEYRYSDVEARGADSVGESRGTSDDSDPSYERDSFELDLRYRPPKGQLWIVDEMILWMGYMAYYFTSDKVLYRDPYHVGRLDEFYRAELEFDTEKIYGPINLYGGYRYTERTTSAPWKGDIAEDKDYVSNRFWIGVHYPF